MSQIGFMEYLKGRKWGPGVPRGLLLGPRAYIKVRCYIENLVNSYRYILMNVKEN